MRDQRIHHHAHARQLAATMRQQHAGGDFAGMPRRQDLLQAASSDGPRTQAAGQHGDAKTRFCRRDQ